MRACARMTTSRRDPADRSSTCFRVDAQNLRSPTAPSVSIQLRRRRRPRQMPSHFRSSTQSLLTVVQPSETIAQGERGPARRDTMALCIVRCLVALLGARPACVACASGVTVQTDSPGRSTLDRGDHKVSVSVNWDEAWSCWPPWPFWLWAPRTQCDRSDRTPMRNL